MNSDPADNVYTTRVEADAADSGDQPEPALNKKADSAKGERPSAIERQRAAMQLATTRNRVYQNLPPPPPPPPPTSRFASYFDALSNFDGSRFGRRAFGVLVLTAVSLLLIFSSVRAVKKDTAPQAESAQITKTLQKIPAAGTASALDAANGIVVPISDVSLRVRPELLQQLVAIYRLRLVSDPNNSAATATLSRMREHSLAELNVISATESAPIATASLNLAANLFPELSKDLRYRSIAARITKSGSEKAPSQRPVAAAPAAAVATPKPVPGTTPALSIKPTEPLTPASTKTAPPLTLASTKQTQPLTPVPTKPAQPLMPTSSKLAPPPIPAATSTTSAPAAVAPRKPQVRVISMTSGVMRKDRFVPADGGNVFRLNIGYRHRDNPLVDQPGAGLVAQLSESGSSTLLAEVPVDIVGSYGQKTFLMNTSTKGRLNKFYKLNFIVDGNVLPSHTIQLTRQWP